MNGNNKKIEESRDGSHREDSFNAPAFETEWARVNLVGCFRQDNVAVGQAATAAAYQAVDANAPTTAPMPHAGKVVGIMIQALANPSAGSITAQASKGGVAIGQTVAVSHDVQVAKTIFTDLQEVAFAAGDQLGVLISSSGDLGEATTEVDVWLLIRWNA